MFISFFFFLLLGKTKFSYRHLSSRIRWERKTSLCVCVCVYDIIDFTFISVLCWLIKKENRKSCWATKSCFIRIKIIIMNKRWQLKDKSFPVRFFSLFFLNTQLSKSKCNVRRGKRKSVFPVTFFMRLFDLLILRSVRKKMFA